MRVAFVVQRYGLEICGGSEFLCRQIAERMARHWDVEILTSCAIDHTTWRNEYRPGADEVNGIAVRRFPVDAPRDILRFKELSARAFRPEHTRQDELAWLDGQGPYSTAFNAYVGSEGSGYDVVVFFTYLYALTFYGLRAVAERSVLVPTAHDELPIYLGIYRDVFSLPRALVFNTPPEQLFVNRRFGTGHVPQDVIGLGIERPADADARRFLERHRERLEGADFVLYAGRIEEAKACHRLFGHFTRFREDAGQPRVKLVLLGSNSMPIPEHPDIVHLGFVPEQEKFDAIAAARLLILCSPHESLSLAALEAWCLGRPVLANGGCEVLRDQCARSGGGLWYETYAEFREALSLLLGDAALRDRLGASGRSFVERFYDWRVIESKYRRIADVARSAHAGGAVGGASRESWAP
jgi:glycosyltransferase involved in cell wall biosynthesis